MLPIGGGQEKPPLKQIPFPGLIDGHKWRVKEGRWPVFIDRSDLEGEGGIMQVPLDDSDVGRKLRLHEQAHVTFTDNDLEVNGVSELSVEACEDGRIIHLMNQRDDWRNVNEGTDVMPPSVIARHREDFARLAQKLSGAEEASSIPGTLPTPTIPLVQAARLIAMTRGYYEARHFDDMAYQNNLNWAVQKVNEMHRKFIQSKKRPTMDDTVAYARELERYFNEMEEQLVQANGELRKADLPHDIVNPKQLDKDLEWGEMRMEEAPLTEKLRADPSRKQRATDMGAVPRYMHRLLSDQRVFGRRRKHKVYQGTVLIDHSGSMGLSTDQVDEMLSRWPAVTIATYSGSGSGWGVLRIVAKNGKRAAQEYLRRPCGGANEIDGPALDWLIKQKRPRLWISDGYVSGKRENFHNWFNLDAAKKVNRGKIKRLEDVQDLLDA